MAKKRRATMKDIAAELGISINAVSLALNNKLGVSQAMRERVFQTAEALGYFENKPRYKQAVRQRTLCLIMRRMYFSSSSFYSQVILGVQEEAALQGYSVLIEILDDDDRADVPESITERLVSAVMILGAVSNEYLSRIEATGVDLILLDHCPAGFRIDSIMTANEDGSFRLTQYLLKQGYQRFGFFGDLDYSNSIRERFAGLTRALYLSQERRSLLDIHTEVERYSLLQNLESLVVDGDVAGVWEQVVKLPSLPDVFVCSNDDAAALLLLALAQHQIVVPLDVAVCGFDNSVIAEQVRPQLTTMNVHKKVMGREAVRRLIWRIHNPDALVTRTSIQTELIVRESTR